MSYLRSFRPWIAYGLAAALIDWRAAAAIACLVAAREVRRQEAEHGDVDDLTMTTRWFFLGLTIVSILRPDTPLHHYTPALSLLALGRRCHLVADRRQALHPDHRQAHHPCGALGPPPVPPRQPHHHFGLGRQLPGDRRCVRGDPRPRTRRPPRRGSEQRCWASPFRCVFTTVYRQHLRDRALQPA